jgi:hypothetical protein
MAETMLTGGGASMTPAPSNTDHTLRVPPTLSPKPQGSDPDEPQGPPRAAPGATAIGPVAALTAGFDGMSSEKSKRLEPVPALALMPALSPGPTPMPPNGSQKAGKVFHA